MTVSHRSDLSRDALRRARLDADRAQREAMPAARLLLDAAPSALVADLGRRRFLSIGAAGVSMAAVLAACAGTNTGAESDGPRVPVAGEVPVTTGLEEHTVDDVVLLRTASSLEHNAIDTYEAAIGLGVLTGALADVAKMFQQHHREHAGAFEAATKAAGGEPFTTANPVVLKKILEPALGLIGKSSDVLGDVLRLAHALESIAAGTYQQLVPALTEPALRKAAMSVGAVEARHAAVLANAMKGAFTPGLGDPNAAPTTTSPDNPVVDVFMVPGAFGSLAQVPVVLNKTRLDLDLPGPNSFMYPKK
jgi:rubrerythrin